MIPVNPSHRKGVKPASSCSTSSLSSAGFDCFYAFDRSRILFCVIPFSPIFVRNVLSNSAILLGSQKISRNYKEFRSFLFHFGCAAYTESISWSGKWFSLNLIAIPCLDLWASHGKGFLQILETPLRYFFSGPRRKGGDEGGLGIGRLNKEQSVRLFLLSITFTMLQRIHWIHWIHCVHCGPLRLRAEALPFQALYSGETE